MKANTQAALLAVLHLAETLCSRKNASLPITPMMWSELTARCSEVRGTMAPAQ